MSEKGKGTLYLVATPIGNLEDISQRALRILGEVDLIAAEDTRHTLKLLNYFGIKKRLVSCYKETERERAGYLVEQIQSGANVALVSDAGMPGISDPGQFLVQAVLEAGINVIPIPGPAALVTALAASGLETGTFLFAGFLPRKAGEQKAELQRMSEFPGTLIFYEAPHRLLKTLEIILAVLGDRPAVLARELTKLHEEFLRGNLDELIHKMKAREIRGEFTVLVAGKTGHPEQCAVSTNFDFSGLEQGGEGRGLRRELKKLATGSGVSSKEVYRQYLEKKKQKK